MDPPKEVVEPPKAPVVVPKAQIQPVEEEPEEPVVEEPVKIVEAPQKHEVEENLKKKGLWDASDEDSEEEVKNVLPAKTNPPVAAAIQPPKKVGFQESRPSAGVQLSEDSKSFKDSLAGLLAKGNPLAPGAPRRQTTRAKKEDEEEKEKIKLDVFKDEEELGNEKYKNAGVLDNVNTVT